MIGSVYRYVPKNETYTVISEPFYCKFFEEPVCLTLWEDNDILEIPVSYIGDAKDILIA